MKMPLEKIIRTSVLTGMLWAGIGVSIEAAPPLVIHEWGTFTSLQDENGKAIGGINTDDEPVPEFVHRLTDFLLLRPTQLPPGFFQGAPRCHPDVTMRLETPVLYFHLPPEEKVSGMSLTARFRGGWLSEFYPNADAVAPGITTNFQGGLSFGALHSETVGSLSWKNFEAGGGDWKGPNTDAHVWIAPRAVAAASVKTQQGEAENFLFYRGVAHADAPITITQEADGSRLVLHDHCPSEIAAKSPLVISSLWLVDIRDGGELAFRKIPGVALDGKGGVLSRVSSEFSAGDYSTSNVPRLKGRLHRALVTGGLFDDEALALLNTWELSYFKSSGMRVFFLVPRAWTDFELPLSVSQASEITRVMVGRIEIETPRQRELLRELAGFSSQSVTNEMRGLWKDFYGSYSAEKWEKLSRGGAALADFYFVPKTYRTYLALGRFRNALVLDAARKEPASGLKTFISTYRLEGYKTAK